MVGIILSDVIIMSRKKKSLANAIQYFDFDSSKIEKEPTVIIFWTENIFIRSKSKPINNMCPIISSFGINCEFF